MKTLFKLVVFLLIVNALVRFVPPYYHHHEYEQAVEAAALQWRKESDAVLIEQLLAEAAKHQVPVRAQDISIRRTHEHLYVDIAYDVPLELVPTVKSSWKFEVNVDSWVLRPPAIPK
jgi:hypothetical protein